MNFNPSSGIFIGAFTVNTSIRWATQIYFSGEFYYPNGFILEVTTVENGDKI